MHTIGASDTGAVQEVVGEAHNMLVATGVDITRIGTAELCTRASDVVTRAAHSLGVVASREWHHNHGFTSFAPLDRMPSEDDPILDLTWGQFNPYEFSISGLNEFFGPRGQIAGYVGEDYSRRYSAASTGLRQVAHTPSADYPGEHLWLRTTPVDIASGAYSIGEVSAEEFAEMRKGLTGSKH